MDPLEGDAPPVPAELTSGVAPAPASAPGRPLDTPLRHPDIEALWIAAAGQLGWHVDRTRSAYASSDGGGKIVSGVDEILDADDAVAQLIFHELCHGLVEGPEKWSIPDWGLCNRDGRDVTREHACLRVQVHLT